MKNTPKTYTKQELIAKLKEISAMGFVPNARHKNHGGIECFYQNTAGRTKRTAGNTRKEK